MMVLGYLYLKAQSLLFEAMAAVEWTRKSGDESVTVARAVILAKIDVMKM